MKKISSIFSVLAIAVLAIVAMGCPVAYVVSNPLAPGVDYTIDSSVAGFDASAVTIDIGEALDGAMQLGAVPTIVSFDYTVRSAGNWNLDGCVWVTGPLTTANYNLIATKDTNWWGSGFANYFVIGGHGTTFLNNVGGTVSGTSNWGGDILAYSGPASLDISASAYPSNRVITINQAATSGGSSGGPLTGFNMKVVISNVQIAY